MPEITYRATGSAPTADRDATQAELRSWCNSDESRTLDRIEHRHATEAIAVEFRWDVPLGEVSTRVASLDAMLADDSRIPAELPPATEAAEVSYP